MKLGSLVLFAGNFFKITDSISLIGPVVCLFVCLFVYLSLAVLGLRCCTRAFSSCSERELLFVAVRGLLIADASLVAEHGL